MRGVLVCAAVLGAALACDARAAEPADTPAGLSIVWRTPGRNLSRGATGDALNAFSPDGRYLAIHESRRVRVVEARSGKQVRDFRLDPSSSTRPLPRCPRPQTSRSASWAMPRSSLRARIRFVIGATAPAARSPSVAFSPDERFLAFQGTRGLPEWRSGLGGVVSVVDLTRGGPVNLEAVASIAQVGFSPDGRSFCAMSVTQLDDRHKFAVRVWSTADWSLTHDITGSKPTMRRVAPLGSVPYAGVSMNDGRIEARDLANDRVLWLGAAGAAERRRARRVRRSR